MRHQSFTLACGALLAAAAVGAPPAAQAADLPDYLKAITGTTPQTPDALATRDVLQLNTSMFALYDAAANTFQSNIMARIPSSWHCSPAPEDA